MPTNTKESGLEDLIVDWFIEKNGYELGVSEDYDCEYAVDEKRLLRFLEGTQHDQMVKIGIRESDMNRAKFLNRLRSEISERGIVDVLRRGMRIHPATDLIMFYMTPSEKNPDAKELFGRNIFSITRQLKYSGRTEQSLDMCIFINGLPVITFELKNQLTKQDVNDAVKQYKGRDVRELIFKFKRCMVHFAIDDSRIMFCTKLNGNDSWFLPFDKGYDQGAGNTPNPDGLKTDYLWKDILTKVGLTDIIENYAQVTEEKNDAGKVSEKQIFPRYHQLSVVRLLLTDIREKGVGQRYLIQHSAGSGKSNSIAWLAHQLVELEIAGDIAVDSVIVVTDRVNLDKQISGTIRQFMQSPHIVVNAENSGDLGRAIADGKKIIITTIQKFPYILKDIGLEHRGRKFAIIIDEAHSSQSGNLAATMNLVLGGNYDEDASIEEILNLLAEGRKLLSNASYFAFTATPKNKTLELFGIPDPQPDGKINHRPFHSYSMKQAIQEGFILDVLRYYTPVESYYRLVKTLDDDPQFDKKKALKKLRKFVERNKASISVKAEIMVEHFHNQTKNKIGWQAHAMVVTSSIKQAIDYYDEICRYLKEINSPYKAIVAFSGDVDIGGKKLNESTINGFSSKAIEKTFRKDPYRFLVVADKFQTGYDEPLLHTMYVDKPLSDIKAVQTLSRLNRAHPLKNDTFILDFANDIETIRKAFSDYYQTTILSDETDPNQLYDLMSVMERHDVYTKQQINEIVDSYLGNVERDKLDPVLDFCAERYKQLDDDAQIEFKSSVKGFIRTYRFLGALLPEVNVTWERLYVFLTFLLPKLPSPKEDDLSEGILEVVDLDSYRAVAREQIAIRLDPKDAVVDPVPTGTARKKPEPELDMLSSIIEDFNNRFGNIGWNDPINMGRQIARIPIMVSKDKRYQNAMLRSDKQEARTESDRALKEFISKTVEDIDLQKQFFDTPAFREWLSEMVFKVTYNKEGKPLEENATH